MCRLEVLLQLTYRFFPLTTWGRLHPTRETPHLLRVLKNLTSPPDSFVTHWKSLEEPGTCEGPHSWDPSHNCSCSSSQICTVLAWRPWGNSALASWEQLMEKSWMGLKQLFHPLYKVHLVTMQLTIYPYKEQLCFKYTHKYPQDSSERNMHYFVTELHN